VSATSQPSCAAATALVIRPRSFFVLALALYGRASRTSAKISVNVPKTL